MIFSCVRNLVLLSCTVLLDGCTFGDECYGGWSVMVASNNFPIDSARFVMTDRSDTILDITRSYVEKSPFAIGRGEIDNNFGQFQIAVLLYCGNEQVVLQPFMFTIHDDGTSGAYINLSGQNGGHIIAANGAACGDLSNVRIIYNHSDTCP